MSAFAIVPDELVTSTGAFPPNTKVMGSGSMETDEGRGIEWFEPPAEGTDSSDDEYRKRQRIEPEGLMVDWTATR